MSNADQVAHFRRLHTQGVLRIANAWDAGSARLIESLGAPAIATTALVSPGAVAMPTATSFRSNSCWPWPPKSRASCACR